MREGYEGFKDLRTVAEETLADLQMMNGDLDRVTISGGGDPSCYPEFYDLIELLGSMEVPLHIGYTSGKGFDDPGSPITSSITASPRSHTPYLQPTPGSGETGCRPHARSLARRPRPVL